MNCKTKEDLISAVENKNILFNVMNSDSQQDIVGRIELVNQSVEKVEDKYQLGDIAFKTTVTTEAGKLSKKKFQPNPVYEQQAVIGNYVHDLLEEVINQLYGQVKDDSVRSAILKLKSISDTTIVDSEGLKKINALYDKELNSKDKSLENIVRGARDLVVEVYRKQLQINNRTGQNDKPVIFTEVKVLDPKQSIGGTIDFLAVLSDKSVILRDYKTKVNKGGSLISWFDEQKYNFQIASYMKILRKTYGIVGGSQRILPIKLSVPFNTTSKSFSNIIGGVVMPGQDEDVEQYIPFNESTGFKGMDNLIANINKRILALEQSLKSAQDKEEIETRIEALEFSKREILVNHSLDSLVKTAQDLIQLTRSKDLSEFEIDHLLDIKSELLMLGEVGRSTYEYRKYLRQAGNNERADKMQDQIDSILGEIEETVQDVNDTLLNKKATVFIEESTGIPMKDNMGNIIPFIQEGMFGKYFYQLSQYENPVFQTLRRLLDEANYNKKQELEKIFSDVQSKENAVFSWLATQGKDHKALVDIFVDQSTGNFYSKWDKDYANEFFNATSADLPNYLTVTSEFTEWYNAQLAKTQAKYNNDPLLTTEDKIRNINRWIQFNSLELNKDNTAKYPKAWEKHKSKLEHKSFKESKEYQYIKSVPALLAYYEMFEEYNKQFRSMLGVDYSTLPNNFIPNIRKDMAERIDTLGLVSGLGGTMEDFVRQFGINEEDRDLNGSYDERKSIPIFFMNPFRNKEGKISVTEKSFQLGRSLMLFANMAYNFREMNQIESRVQMLREFLAERGEQFITKGGKVQSDMVGNQLIEKLDPDLLNVFDRYVDMYLYGISVQPTLLDKDGKAEKALLAAKSYFSLKALGLNFIAAGGSFLAAKYATVVEGNKGVIYTKTDYLNSFKLAATERKKFLALNAVLDPMGHRLRDPQLAEKEYGELAFGDQSKRGFINQYVNSRLLMRPFSLGDEYIDEHILVSMAQNFYVDNNGNLKSFRNFSVNEDGTVSSSDIERQKYADRTIWNLFSYDNDNASFNLTPEQTKNVVINFRRAVQAGQSKIKGTIPEEDKAYWQSQIIGSLMMQFKSWMPGIMFERWGKVKYDSRIDSMYMGKFTALWQEFRSPESMMRAVWFKDIFIPKLKDLTKHLVTFGYYKSVDKYQKEMLFEQWLDNHPQYRGKVTFEDFYIIQQQQLKSALREIRVLIAFSFVLALLAGDWDDDGEKDYRKYLLSRKLVALLSKMNQEMAFVYNPNDLASMIKTPLPMLGLVTDTTKALSNTVDELLDIPFGEDRFIGGQKKDKTQIGYYSHKLVPGGNVLDVFDLWKEDNPR